MQKVSIQQSYFLFLAQGLLSFLNFICFISPNVLIHVIWVCVYLCVCVHACADVCAWACILTCVFISYVVIFCTGKQSKFKNMVERTKSKACLKLNILFYQNHLKWITTKHNLRQNKLLVCHYSLDYFIIIKRNYNISMMYCDTILCSPHEMNVAQTNYVLIYVSSQLLLHTNHHAFLKICYFKLVLVIHSTVFIYLLWHWSSLCKC